MGTRYNVYVVPITPSNCFETGVQPSHSIPGRSGLTVSVKQDNYLGKWLTQLWSPHASDSLLFYSRRLDTNYLFTCFSAGVTMALKSAGGVRACASWIARAPGSCCSIWRPNLWNWAQLEKQWAPSHETPRTLFSLTTDDDTYFLQFNDLCWWGRQRSGKIVLGWVSPVLNRKFRAFSCNFWRT